MAFSNLMVDTALLRENPDFRRVLVARAISLMGLGLLAVSVPVQIFALTGSSFHVGLVTALEGGGMFAGLLAGGVLADLHDRRRLILFARSVCGLGFVALAANALLPEPSLAAIYVLAVWDGFFGALGVSALMAALPQLVRRENVMQAGALGMITARLASIASPALGGAIIAGPGLTWNYALAAAGTLLTVLTLLGLPSLRPERPEVAHPLRMLAEGVRFVARSRALVMLFAFGAFVALLGAIRILFPAFADGIGAGGVAIGLLYAAVPLGAALGGIFSGWAAHAARPARTMAALCLAAALAVVALGAGGSLAAALAALVVYGYVVAIAGLIQYSLIQAETPDSHLGRVNALWSAQDSLGEIMGALLVGLVAGAMAPGPALVAFGATALGAGLLLCLATRPAGQAAEAQP